MKRLRRLVTTSSLLILIAASLAACGANQPAAEPIDAGNAIVASQSRLIDKGSGRPTVGDMAPDFSYTMPDGSVQQLSSLRGKPVLINFWATWCLPCIDEMPAIQQAMEESGDELVVLAVNRNELPEAIARFGSQYAFTFPLIANIDGDISDRYGVLNLPTSYFVNSDGTISAYQIGALTDELLAEQVEALK